MTLDRAAALLEDVLAEPESLERTIDAYATPGGPLAAIPGRARHGPTRVVLTGLGSSRFAAEDAATDLRSAGVAAWSEPASTDRPTPSARDVVLVAISASGRTPEVLDAVERHRGTSLVIAVTNHPEEPIGSRADVVLPLLAGDERSGVACRTYQATNAVLAMLAGVLGGGPVGVDRLQPAVPALHDLIAAREAWLEPVANLLDGARVGLIGPAGDHGLLEQGALMLREAPRMEATAHETADWLHTAVYTALPRFRAILLEGSAADELVARTILGRGGAVARIGARPASGPSDGERVTLPAAADALDRPVRRLVLSAVPELLAATLWLRATSNERALESPSQAQLTNQRDLA